MLSIALSVEHLVVNGQGARSFKSSCASFSWPDSSYVLCRLCLGPWTEHGERTGGFYACNRYEAAKTEGVVSVAPSLHRQPLLSSYCVSVLKRASWPVPLPP